MISHCVAFYVQNSQSRFDIASLSLLVAGRVFY